MTHDDKETVSVSRFSHWLLLAYFIAGGVTFVSYVAVFGFAPNRSDLGFKHVWVSMFVTGGMLGGLAYLPWVVLRRQHPRVHFSVRTLLIVMTVVAVTLGIAMM